MASIGNPAWSTTFFYAQDLRSLYMNGLLANIVKPGIYNPNMAVFAKDTSQGSASNPSNNPILKDTPQGLYLYIKKGTTFIFSNNYRYTNSKDVIRDMKSTGSFIIKSTTLDDTYLPIDIIGSVSSKMLFGQETTNSQVDYKAEKEIYLYAILNYSGEADLNVPNIPQIQWCTRNLEYLKQGAGISYMFNNQMGGDKFRIPDGKGTFNDSTSQTCYLFLGTLTRKKTATTDKYIGASGDNWIAKGGEKFIEDYIFTGRGFPEYRQTSEQFSSVFKPDFTFSHDTFSPTTGTTTETVPNYYLSAESMSLGSNVFSTDKGYNWRGYFGLESGTPPNSAKFTFHNWSSSLPSPGSNTEPNELLITDLVYLSVHNRTSEETTEELLGSLLKTNNTEVPTLESFSWVTYGKDSDENKIPQIFNPNQFDIQAVNSESEIVVDSEPWDETNNKVNISYSENAYHSKLETPKHTTTTSASYILSGVPTINLDTNVSNIERLASIIENKNVVPTVIEYIRRHRNEDKNNAENHMDASKCSSIIPVALAFRKFKKVDDAWKSIDSVSTLKGTVHPSNILNFFDLQSSAMKVFDVSIETSDVYTILPVID